MLARLTNVKIMAECVPLPPRRAVETRKLQVEDLRQYGCRFHDPLALPGMGAGLLAPVLRKLRFAHHQDEEDIRVAKVMVGTKSQETEDMD